MRCNFEAGESDTSPFLGRIGIPSNANRVYSGKIFYLQYALGYLISSLDSILSPFWVNPTGTS